MSKAKRMTPVLGLLVIAGWHGSTTYRVAVHRDKYIAGETEATEIAVDGGR